MNDLTRKNPMPSLDPQVRARNFEEVALGYDAQTAIKEAKRCLNCKNRPCVAKCPVGIAIPDFISKIAGGEFEEAYQIIERASSLAAVCGRVCPQERQCESVCARGIKGESVGIGYLERFVADYHLKNLKSQVKKSTEGAKKVAVVGSGPAGLSCAGELAKRGYDVTVFEALHKSGGVLTYGIPEFRLPKSIVQNTVSQLENMGVTFKNNFVIGKTLSVDGLFEQGFGAVFIGTGAGLPKFMGIPGEALCGVYSANEYLTRINLMKAYKEDSKTPIQRGGVVAVVGGGNVAMDAARCALRLGASKVYILYRRSEKELPARAEEVHHAKQEGIQFEFMCNPVELIGDKDLNVTAVKCQKTELSQPDESGRRRPVPIEGSEYEIPVNTVIMALGTSPNPLIRRTTQGLECDNRGRITVTENTTATTKKGVFAGGDTVTGAATVILAMGAGKQAAAEIDEYLSK